MTPGVAIRLQQLVDDTHTIQRVQLVFTYYNTAVLLSSREPLLQPFHEFSQS